MSEPSSVCPKCGEEQLPGDDFVYKCLSVKERTLKSKDKIEFYQSAPCRIRELEQKFIALIKYVQHLPGCATNADHIQEYGKCDCGLSEILEYVGD